MTSTLVQACEDARGDLHNARTTITSRMTSLATDSRAAVVGAVAHGGIAAWTQWEADSARRIGVIGHCVLLER